MFLGAFPRKNHCCPVLHLAGHRTWQSHWWLLLPSHSVHLLCCHPGQLSADRLTWSSASLEVLQSSRGTGSRGSRAHPAGAARTEAAVTPPGSAPLFPLAAGTPTSQNTQATLQLCRVQIKPSLIPAAVRVELQRWTPCCAHHKLTRFEIYRNEDIPGAFHPVPRAETESLAKSKHLVWGKEWCL